VSASSAALRWAEVDLDALQHNVHAVRRRLSPGTELMAMVKSNGYGHGLVLAARGALDGGATWLGVYHAHEALQLREAQFRERVLVVGATPDDVVPELVAADVDLAVPDAAQLERLSAVAAGARVHLKIDTGLNRLGVRPEGIDDLVRAAEHAGRRLQIAVMFTHFADADGADLSFTREQHRRFSEAVAPLRPYAPDALLHCAGTAATLRMPETHRDLVRIGIALYGYVPANCEDPGLRLAMRVMARVVQVKTVQAGDTVGYSRTWTASAARCIATVALGYGQGLPRYVSNRGSVVVRGARCPIVGIVSMDQVGVDVSEVDSVSVGDAAMLIGEQDGVRLGADEVGAIGGTLPHEVLCGISESVPRLAVDDPGAGAAVP